MAASYAVDALGGRLTWHGTEDPIYIGNAVHSWLCVDMPAILAHTDREKRQAWFAAAWKLTPADGMQLQGMSDRLHGALSALAAASGMGDIVAYHVEWPVYQRLGQQILSGRMDMLVECANGCILVDHKYEIADATAELYKQTVKDYSGQMQAYLNALYAAGYNNVIACLHLPAQGVLLRYETM